VTVGKHQLKHTPATKNSVINKTKKKKFKMPRHLGIANQQKAHAGTQVRDPTAVDSVDIGISSEYVRNTLSSAITDLEVRILTLYIRKFSSYKFFSLCQNIFMDQDYP